MGQSVTSEAFCSPLFSACFQSEQFKLYTLPETRWSEKNTIQLEAAPLEAISLFYSFPLSARLNRLLVSPSAAMFALKENIKFAENELIFHEKGGGITFTLVVYIAGPKSLKVQDVLNNTCSSMVQCFGRFFACIWCSY